MENNSTQKPWLSKGERKSRGLSRTGAQGICWCWHLPSLHLQAKSGDPVGRACVCVCVREGAGKKEDGYVLTCAMRIDPTWPPYVAETRRMASYKATLPVFTCVPALYTSSSRSSITAVYVCVKIHLPDCLNISNVHWLATTLNPPSVFNVVVGRSQHGRSDWSAAALPHTVLTPVNHNFAMLMWLIGVSIQISCSIALMGIRKAEICFLNI